MSSDYQVYIVQLTSDIAKERYDAICHLARNAEGNNWRAVYDAVWERAENDPDKRVSAAAGIAASMISARNTPGGSMFGGVIPDFLMEWED